MEIYDYVCCYIYSLYLSGIYGGIFHWIHSLGGGDGMTASVWMEGLGLVFQPSVLLFLCAGVLIGTAIGALPGLSATMGIAIMTPITFWFEPVDGFAMLMGLWNAAIFAGGISAILVNTP